MKKAFLLSVLTGFVLHAAAQPTLTSAINPQAGATYTRHYTTIQQPGSAGANVVWDFSNLTDTAHASADYEGCSNNNCVSFSGATLKYSAYPAQPTYFSASSSTLSYVGTTSGQVDIVYSNFEDYLRYPFTYHNTFSDSFEASYTAPNGSYYRYGSVADTADAYGTLKLPSRTYNNVLRVHRVEVYQDFYFGGGSPNPPQQVETYAWYSPLINEVLMTVTTVSDVNTNITIQRSAYTIYNDVAPTGITGIKSIENTFSVYPNPATDGNFTVTFSLQHAQPVHITLVDMIGCSIRTLASGNYEAGALKVSVAANGLASGIYMLRLQTGEASVTKKIEIR